MLEHDDWHSPDPVESVEYWLFWTPIFIAAENDAAAAQQQNYNSRMEAERS